MPIITLAAGRDRSVALTQSGQAWAWGALRTWDASTPALLQPPVGEICSSDPALVGHNRYAQPRALLLNTATPFALVAESHAHTLAVCRAGQAWSCQPLVDPRKGSARQRLEGLPATLTQLVATASAGLALDGRGAVWSWGLDTEGQLGRTAQAWYTAAGRVADMPPMVQLATGSAHVLALDSEGTVWSWGANAAGQLGHGTLQASRQARAVTLPVPVQRVAAGDTHSLALDVEGQLWAWGANNHGQTGLAEAAYFSRPQRVRLAFAPTHIDGGMFYTVALAAQGEVYAWGWNGLGQAGHSTRTSSHQPTAIRALRNITLLAAGSSHVLASNGQQVFAWGDNRSAACGAAASQACIHTPVTITLA